MSRSFRNAFLLLLFFPGALPARDPAVEARARAAAVLKGKGDFIERRVIRAGDQTLRLEGFVSFEGDFNHLPDILSDLPRYGSWMLKNINQRPEGGTYWVKVMALEVKPGEPNVLKTLVQLDFPFYKKDMERRTRVKASRHADHFRLDAEMIPAQDSAVVSATATLHFFPAEGEAGRIWAAATGRAKLNNWLIYEALPARALTREAGQRIRILAENYQDEELRRLRLNRSPKGKKEESSR